MNRNAERYWKACAELGLRAELGFTLKLAGGQVLTPFIRISDLGAPNGMLLFSSYDEVRDHAKALMDAGYGASVLDEPRPDEEVEIETYQDVFRDWGWTGDPDKMPEWMQ